MSQNKLKSEEHENGVGLLRGSPGYRTREGRFGLDPIDTPAEEAHMEGMFYRNLFTLRLRTRNPFYLVLMFFLGIIPFLALSYFTTIVVSELDSSTWPGFAFASIFTLITGALTINLILSILEIVHVIPPLTKSNPKPKVREKKMPKRRKDFGR